MSERYGKIKNGKLILAPLLINRDDSIIVQNNALYIEKGYKKLLYTTPPENREGYNLVNDWEEQQDLIVQKWDYKEIGDDYSGELLVAVRKFNWSVSDLKREIKANYDSNEKCKEDLLKRNRLIKLIYEHKKEEITTGQLLEHLSVFDLDLGRFFDWLQMKETLEKMNYIIIEGCLFYISDELKDFEAKAFMETELTKLSDKQRKIFNKNMIMPQYFKRNLSMLHSYETHSTNSNRIMYNMSFIYLFTLFDEVLLKIIRIICMHEKKWLISNGNLSAEEILKCDTTDELHMLLVEKKVNELAWGSYSDKLTFLQDRGIKIDTEHIKLFNDIILYLSIRRNVLVHNEGIWNQAAKNLLKGTDYYQKVAVDKSIERTYESFEEACDYIESAITYLYNQLCDKFRFLHKYNFLKNDYS